MGCVISRPASTAAAPLAAAGAGGGGPACAPLNVQPSQSAPASNDTSAMPSEGQAAHSGGGPGTPPLEEGPAKPQPQPIAIVPPVEAERLEALRALQLLGAPPQARFETITNLVQRIFGVAMVAVALIDERMHLLAKMGPLQCDGTRVGSFCDWALASDTPTMVVIEDTREDARFRDFPHVQMEGGVRFYAGAPLVSSHGGRKYGTLCVMDFRPRSFPPSLLAMLAHFAEIAVREMERDVAEEWHQHVAPEEPLLRSASVYSEGLVLLDLSTAGWDVLFCNDQFRDAAAMPALLLGGGSEGGAGGGEPRHVDFWRHFSVVTSSGRSPFTAAMEAVQSGRPFHMAVRTNRASCAPGRQPPLLSMRFKPADREQLRERMPHIGIPPLAGMAAVEEATPRNYYWGLVEAARADSSAGAQAAPVAAQQQAVAATAAAAAAEPALISVGLGAGARAIAASPFSRPPTRTQPAALQDTPVNRAECERLIPGFFLERPEVMQEVELGPLVGTGARGRCYRGVWQGARVAVKVLEIRLPSHGDSAKASEAEAARLEALLARSLSHPHVVTTFAHASSVTQVPGTDERRHQVWIIQEFCAKGSLLEAIDKGALLAPGGGPNLAAVLMAAREVAGALVHLHAQGVIHGDLTPSNVLLQTGTRDARRWVCKVGDFGLSRVTGSDGDRIRRAGFGTLTHCAPELVLRGELSRAADVWSFGVLLLEMYRSQRAWLGMAFPSILRAISNGQRPFAIPEGAPPALASLLERCSAVDPVQRPTFPEVLLEVQAQLLVLAREREASLSRHSSDGLPALLSQESLLRGASFDGCSGAGSARPTFGVHPPIHEHAAADPPVERWQ